MFKSLQICGTSGSGKTTIVRALMLVCNAEAIRWNEKGTKPVMYAGDHPDGTRMYFLGSYETVCGGCDTINGVAVVAQLLQDLHDEGADGICIFEGLMHSHMVGTIGAKQIELGVENHQRAFLDTPLKVCLDRVLQRRAESARLKGKLVKPFNTANTQKDWPRVRQCMFNCEKQGIIVHDVFYKSATEAIMQIIEEMFENV